MGDAQVFNQDEHNSLLRQRAEEALQGKFVDLTGISSEDFQVLLHELQIYQAELVIQNDELRRIQNQLESSREQLADLYDFAPMGYCSVNKRDQILESNQTLADLLKIEPKKLLRKHFTELVCRDDQDQYNLHRLSAFSDHQRRICEIRMLKQTGALIYVHVESAIAHDDPSRLRVVVADITEQKRAEEALREAQTLLKDTLEDVQHQLIDQREQERLQIARALHDGPIQELLIVTFKLHELILDAKDAAVADHFEEIQQLVQNQINALRSYTWDLRPPILFQFGLEHAIRSKMEDFQRKHPTLHIRLEMYQTRLSLPEAIRLSLFRIFQEALSNLEQHARATEIVIRLVQTEEKVQLEIQDNGVGFEIPKELAELASKGDLGLLGMRERAQAARGSLTVRSSPGAGTKVQVIIPMAG
jgi:PAS domain S-box-containing protein